MPILLRSHRTQFTLTAGCCCAIARSNQINIINQSFSRSKSFVLIYLKLLEKRGILNYKKKIVSCSKMQQLIILTLKSLTNYTDTIRRQCINLIEQKSLKNKTNLVFKMYFMNSVSPAVLSNLYFWCQVMPSFSLLLSYFLISIQLIIRKLHCVFNFGK